MQLSGAPTKVSVPFANSGTKNTIPVASQIGVTPGAASYTDGFPPLTFTPIAAGGIPPAGADFNGILNAITQAVRWQMAGGSWSYDATFSTAISGYPKGSILLKTSGYGLWLNQTDNNANNPDSGGAGWSDLTSGRLLRRLVYTLVSGVQNVSIDGGTPTTTGASTYVPSAAMAFAVAKVQGGGGGGGGTATTGSGQGAAGSGAASGSLGVALLTPANIGASQTVTVGGAGSFGGVNGNGGAGGTSSLGSLITASGGGGGPVGLASAPSFLQIAGVPAGAPTFGGSVTPLLSTGGNAGILGACSSLANGVLSGAGGHSPLTGGGGGPAVLANTIGKPATSVGAGGGGGAVNATQAGTTGGIGGAGCVIIEEYA